MASSVSVVLFGATGTLGSEFARHLSADFEVISPTRSDANLASSGSVTRFLESCTFDLLINAAGWTDVDACETRPEKAMQVNALAVGEMATACKRRGARMIHFSSDYVFPGDGKDLLNEREPSAPINAYGRSKLQGERHVLEEVDNALIIRLSWLFGGSKKGFVSWVLDQAGSDHPFAVVADKWSSPTCSADLVRDITPLLRDNSVRGLLHYSNAGICTWHDWALHIIETSRRLGLLNDAHLPAPATLKEIFNGKAPRPPFTPLDTGSFQGITGIVPRSWQDAVEDHLARKK